MSTTLARKTLISPIVGASFFLVFSASVWAQPRVGGMSGSGDLLTLDEVPLREALALQMSAFSGLEHITVDGDFFGLSESSRGIMSVGESRLTYARRGRRTNFSGLAASTFYGSDRDEWRGVGHQGAAGFETSLTTRTRVGANAGAARMPFYGVTPFTPGALPTAPPAIADPGTFNRDHALTSASVTHYHAGSGLTSQLGSRSTLVADYEARYVQQETPDEVFIDHEVALRLDQRLTRNGSLDLGVRANRGYRELTGDRTTRESYEADIGYTRTFPVSPSRTTTFSVGAGPSVIIERGQRFNSFTGRASLVHWLTRTWVTNLDYRRHAEFFEGFTRPMFVDSASVSLAGRLSRRLGVSSLLGLARGEGVGGIRSEEPYESYSGSLNLTYSITPDLAVNGLGFYYRHVSGDAAFIPGIRLSDFDRYGVAIGLAWRIPIIARRG